MASSLLIAGLATAQSEPDQPYTYSVAELEELVGPIALYPDDLLAIILPASAYPLQIVQASRYLEEYEQNSDLEPNEEWDDSVVALLNYPEVIELMNQDLDWTWQLGEAVVNQQPGVLDAVQRFRDRAYLAGNLGTDERQVVSTDEGVIEIEPVDPEVIYVPYYEPERVVVYQRTPVYHYYPRPRPVYYYPYPADYWFASRLFWGVTTFYTFAWLSDGLHLRHYYHDSHPYYRRTYHTHHYVRHRYYQSSQNVYVNRVDRSSYDSSDRTRYKRRYRGDAWRPKSRHGARPGYRRHARHREPITASTFSGSRQRDHVIRQSRPIRTSSPTRTRRTDRRSTFSADSNDVKRKRVIRTRKDPATVAHSRPTTRSDRKTVRTIRRSQHQKASTRTSERRVTRSARPITRSKNVERQKNVRVRQNKPTSRPSKGKSGIHVAQNVTSRSRPAPKRSQSSVKRGGSRKVSSPPEKRARVAKTSTRKSGANKSKGRSKGRKSRS